MKVQFENGASLCLSEDKITYIETNGDIKVLPGELTEITKELMRCAGKVVYSVTLYDSYSFLNRKETTESEKKTSVNKKIGKLRKFLSSGYRDEFVENQFGYGYKLKGQKSDDEEDNNSGALREDDIPRDIIGFYLDPGGSGEAIGTDPFRAMSIHCDGEKVWMIDGIMTLNVAQEVVGRVFKDTGKIEANFEKVRSEYKGGPMGGSRILFGEKKMNGNLVIFNGRHTETLHTIQVVMDSTFFITARTKNRVDGLRASIALCYVENGKIGTYCTLLGMIRNDLLNKNFDQSNITEWLKMLYTKGYAHNPICLNKSVDTFWYRCCMDVNRRK